VRRKTGGASETRAKGSRGLTEGGHLTARKMPVRGEMEDAKEQENQKISQKKNTERNVPLPKKNGKDQDGGAEKLGKGAP